MKLAFPYKTKSPLVFAVMLGIFGWATSTCKAADATPKGRFEPFIARVQVLPSRPVDVFDGYDTRVLIEFGARGPLPTWWLKGTDFEFHHRYSSGKVVRVKDGVPVSLGKRGYIEAPHPDPKTKRWTCIYHLKLRDVSAANGPLRLQDTIRFESNKVWTKLWLDAPIREKGVATKLPEVSRVPGVTLDGFSFQPVPANELREKDQRWRVRWTITNNEAQVSGTDVNIVNSKGVDVGGGGIMYGFSPFDKEFNDASPQVHLKPDPIRRFGFEDFWLGSKVAPSEPLWLQGSIRCGDQWPLAIKIPIRNAKGQMLFSPRVPTAPPRAVLVAKHASTATEVNGTSQRQKQ